MNGDLLINMDFSLFLNEVDKANNSTICSIPVDDPSRYGVLELDGSKIINFIEKPQDLEYGNNISLGVYSLFREDIQKVKSSVLRAMLDSLALSVHPRVAVVEGQANIEDVMNTEVGGIIRQRNAGAVQPFHMPFVGKDCFPMLRYLDEVKEHKTGIPKA